MPSNSNAIASIFLLAFLISKISAFSMPTNRPPPQVVQNWSSPRPRPSNTPPTSGRFIDLVPYEASKHADELWKAFGGTAEAVNDRMYYFWMPRWESAKDFGECFSDLTESGANVLNVLVDKSTQKAVGMASYMRISEAHGSCEIGCICFADSLQRTKASTEVQYLLAKRVFDELGYRRYEWKLHNENQPSHNAAQRLGFTLEGVFRQHMVSAQGENRDTAWYSMLDHEWKGYCKEAFETWLDDSNFDESGKQKRRLQDIRQELKAAKSA